MNNVRRLLQRFAREAHAWRFRLSGCRFSQLTTAANETRFGLAVQELTDEARQQRIERLAVQFELGRGGGPRQLVAA